MKMEDKLCYYSNSRNVFVGNGVNEYVKNRLHYEGLDKIANWRRILSNFYVEPFVFEGKTYNSVEHAFQAYKTAIASKEKAFLFTIESEHEIGLGDGSVAQKNRKLVVLNPEQIKYWDDIKDEIMTKITLERINQSPTYKNVLLLTGSAQLWHVMVRKGVVRNKYLEDLRDFIRKTE
jgi:predicted NAD-dependent protein-ADP-ribosyltransferase YbiA (DUF1768 family)